MTTIERHSREWATRKSDERFTSLTKLHEHCASVRQRSFTAPISTRALMAAPLVALNTIHAVPATYEDLAVQVGMPNGGNRTIDATSTHYAFGQLCKFAGSTPDSTAPAAYLRGLPAAMAADCLNYGLERNGSRDIQVLLTQQEPDAGHDALPSMRAITSQGYGRIFNSTITGALVQRFGDGFSGDFRIPGTFGGTLTAEPSKADTSLFASDRDFFVFLADQERRITVPARRDGQSGSLARGFFVWNSEVGAASFGVQTFLFDYMCSNRLIWGVEDVATFKMRHTSKAPDRFIEEISPALEAYSRSSQSGIVAAIASAQHARLSTDQDVTAFLERRFSGAQAQAIKATHLAEEGRPIETVWDAVTGVTAYAKGIQWQDARVQVEREGGKLMQLAVA